MSLTYNSFLFLSKLGITAPPVSLVQIQFGWPPKDEKKLDLAGIRLQQLCVDGFGNYEILVFLNSDPCKLMGW